jgi:hypothetical protein
VPVGPAPVAYASDGPREARAHRSSLHNPVPFPREGPRGASSPASSVLRTSPTSRHPSRDAASGFVSFARRYLVCASCSCSARWFGWGSCALDARLAQASGLLSGEPDGPSLTRRSARPPRFLGRLRERALLFDPGGASAPMIVGRLGAAFCWVNGIGLRDHLLSGLDHTARALAVYASQAPSRTTTQDSLPAGDQPLPGGSNYPARRLRRFLRRSSAHRFLLLQASLAH